MSRLIAVQLTTPRTVLRPFSGADVDALHRLWTAPLVRKYLWDGIRISRQRAAEVVAASEADFLRFRFGLWTIRDAASGRLIGFCGLRQPATGSPELLYGLEPGSWQKGLATEAARAVLAYAFMELGIAEVVAATDVPNHASVRVMERLGMQFERRGDLNGLDTLFYRLDRPRFVAQSAS